ncbi:MAG TPA: PQQ-binding-like beta-propeller repeat protein [Ktedonosporobacter sp.]|jgi:outer membrane protein assembly factor BamB|nr:PQQ-binding-like beta-propeller repeat protein [Ktedonosporobacter sp.]
MNISTFVHRFPPGRRFPFLFLFLLLWLVACGSSSQQMSPLLNSSKADIFHLPLSQLTIYVSGGDYAVYALRASDGHQRWSHQFGVGVEGLIVVNGVLFANNEGGVRALRTSNGQELWSHQDGQFAFSRCFLATQTIVTYCAYHSDPFGFSGQTQTHVLRASDGSELRQGGSGEVEINGVLYSAGGTLTAIEESTGKKLWDLAYSRNATSTRPAAAGTTIYDNTGIDGVYALDVVSKKVLWKASTGSPAIDYTNVAVDHGIVYVGAHRDIYAFNASDGRQLWKTPIVQGGDLGGMLVAGDERVYVGAGVNGGTYGFYALRESDGKVLWRSHVVASNSARPVLASGMVYVGDMQRTLHALHASDGQEIWRHRGEKFVGPVSGLAIGASMPV